MSQNNPAHPATQQMLHALRDARTRLEALQQARDEPIAVVGIGCRFPLAATPEEFWALLRDGVDATCEMPADRPEFAAFYDPDPGVEDRAYTRRGGFFRERPDRFDPQFFGISEREAEAMDPQQRLLLEVTWEALEDSGISPERLRKTSTGVFVGLSTDDYHRATTSSRKPGTVSPYAGLGTARSVAAGRISFVYGLHGPCLQVDTACSSSLVVLHLACQSLRSGESAVALAGGVNLVLSPLSTIGRCLMRALSPDGRCKTFDASADGYGQGEGCGIVVLKRLSDALRDGDRIYGLIRGSAVNHDGPSSGLTTPNEAAQEALLRRALANAKVEPAEVAYVEAHGTGTALGDPIEVNALASVFGNRSRPLLIGSVKSNLGHAEAAAGMACLIKTLLALHHRELPPHLHFRNPNPHIAWQRLPVKVVTERMPWPEGRRVAGVSAFGLSGTNAHIVLEEAPATAEQGEAGVRQLLCLSAKSAVSLAAQVRRFAAFLGETVIPLADICDTANRGRSHFAWRVAAVADSAREMSARLASIPLPSAPVDVYAMTVGFSSGVATDVVLPRGELDRLAVLYAQGAEIVWGDQPPRRRPVTLPSYPFEQNRYWSTAVPPMRPETPVQDLLDSGDVAGLCALLGGEVSMESRRLLEQLTARHLGKAAAPFYQLCWEPAVSGAAAVRRSGWAVETAGGAETSALALRLQSLLPVPVPGSQRGVVWLLESQADTDAAEQASALLRRLQRAAAAGERLRLISAGTHPRLAAAVGLGKGAALEMPEVWDGWIELPEDPLLDDLRSVVAELMAGDGEPAIQLSNGERKALRLRRKEQLPVVDSPVSVQSGVDYLIIGGTGAVGLHLARWLVDKGATRLVLTGLRGADGPVFEELRGRGVAVRVVAIDAADEAGMVALVAGLPTLRGVIHAAGTGGVDPLSAMAESRLRDVLRPKVAGAWNLHLATLGRQLDFFLLCSSIASVWGSKAQSHYTAGNQFVDAVAAYRRSLGLPAVSINWGPWAETLSAEAEEWLRRSGVEPLQPEKAFAALDRVLCSGEGQVTVANVDWETFLNVYEARGPRPLMNLVRPGSAPQAVPQPAKLATLPRREVVSRLQVLVSRVLGVGSAPDPAQGFADMGLDSLMAVELKRLVSESFACPLPATVVFNYPTVDRLADYLMGATVEARPPAPAQAVMEARELMALLAKEAEE